MCDEPHLYIQCDLWLKNYSPYQSVWPIGDTRYLCGLGSKLVFVHVDISSTV